MIDLLLLVVIGLVTWCVASEGVWGAALVFLCTLLSGLLAMNFFEPLAVLLSSYLPNDYKNHADSVALVGLFTGFVFALRMSTERIAPVFITLPDMAESIGRWAFAAATGLLTAAILLTAVHTAVIPREYLGFKAEGPTFFGLNIDRRWLGFTQYVSEKSLANFRFVNEKNELIPHMFDGPYFAVGDPNAPYPNKVWPSFPIRYAARRSGFGGAAQPVVVPVARPVGPAGGGGSPGGGQASPGF